MYNQLKENTILFPNIYLTVVYNTTKDLQTLQLQYFQFYLSYNSIRNKETHKLSSFTFYACKNFQIQFKQYETYNRNCFIHENVSKEKLEPRRITIQVNLFSSLQYLLHIKLFHCFKGAVLRQEKTGTQHKICYGKLCLRGLKQSNFSIQNKCHMKSSYLLKI